MDIVRTTKTTLPLPPDGARGVLGRDRHCPGNVLVRTLGNDLEHAHGDLVTVGSKEAGLVPPAGFEPALPPPEAGSLRALRRPQCPTRAFRGSLGSAAVPECL